MNDPANYPRPPIVKGTGTTPAERRLIRLADHSFLDLWSYPNPFRDQKAHGTNGKELCDLLVVCGDHVLIFSEKTYSWPDAPLDVAWARWFNKAIRKSAEQIRGAERWVRDFPERIFLDPACTKPFPISFPPADRRKIHGIVVAGGAGNACKKHFEGGIGSLAIDPSIVGDAHWRGDGIKPFWVGDIDDKGSFIHVLDDGSLDIILRELDTVTDLAQYLEKKAAFIRSGRLHAAAGEEDLLAYYSVRMNDDEHDFIHPDNRPWKKDERVLIDQTHYRSLISDPQFIAKKEADQNSYLWDALIRNFTKHMLAGTSVVPDGEVYDLKKSELAVREMALQSRFERRGHGDAILDALRVSKGREIFIRVLVPEAHARRDVGFFLLIIAYHKMFDAKGGYDEYRRARAAYGELYAKGILLRYPYLDRVVGIIIEPPEDRISSADDILYVGRQEWNETHKEQIREACRNLGIMRDDFVERKYGTREFPDIVAPPRGDRARGNRQQRRAQQSKIRKERRDTQ